MKLVDIGYTEKPIKYQSAFELYKQVTKDGRLPALLMESRTINLAYGKQSIIASNLALKVSGKNEAFRIEALSEQGLSLIEEFSPEDFSFATSYKRDGGSIQGSYTRYFDSEQELSERVKSINASKLLRAVAGKFETQNKYAGLYGAFAYDFVRNFEDIGHKHDTKPGEDFVLYFPTSIAVFDDIKQTGIQFHFGVKGSQKSFKGKNIYLGKLFGRKESMPEPEFISKAQSLISDVNNGRFMQCVLSRAISIPLVEHPIHSYARLREINPSPYCFFFNFGDGEFLYGSSPEIHAVVRGKELTIRPLAGTMPRSTNPLEDAHNRIRLQTDTKERREHMMLVDLARNDAYRLCVPSSVKVTDLLTVEHYPNLYHLASGVTGILKDGHDSIDVLLTTIPAGTLSGAPKLEAMKAIEELENTRRGFYGGAVGYLTFSNGCNTGITIRSVHVKDGFSTVQAGAGIVAGSVPKSEAEEVMLKLSKPLKNLEEMTK